MGKPLDSSAALSAFNVSESAIADDSPQVVNTIKQMALSRTRRRTLVTAVQTMFSPSRPSAEFKASTRLPTSGFNLGDGALRVMLAFGAWRHGYKFELWTDRCDPKAIARLSNRRRD